MSTPAVATQFSFGFARPVSRCIRCGRILTNRNSIDRGTGPVCAYHPTGAAMKINDFTDDYIASPITDGIILTRTNGRAATNVPHIVTHHSPTGYEFGYSGSGPADLALNIAEAALSHVGWTGEKIRCYDGQCFELAWVLHQDLKRQFIAGAPETGCTIPWQSVIDWIQERMPVMEAP